MPLPGACLPPRLPARNGARQCVQTAPGGNPEDGSRLEGASKGQSRWHWRPGVALPRTLTSLAWTAAPKRTGLEEPPLRPSLGVGCRAPAPSLWPRSLALDLAQTAPLPQWLVSSGWPVDSCTHVVATEETKKRKGKGAGSSISLTQLLLPPAVVLGAPWLGMFIAAFQLQAASLPRNHRAS